MTQSFEANPYLDYSMKGMEIADELRQFDEQSASGLIADTDYNNQLTEMAQTTINYLDGGMQRFSDTFVLETEAEGFKRSISGDRQRDFALKLNEVLYNLVSDSVPPIDAIKDTDKLQRAAQLTVVADHINSKNFYDKPNQVRATGDAVIGRVVLHMISYNMNPMQLRLPYR